MLDLFHWLGVFRRQIALFTRTDFPPSPSQRSNFGGHDSRALFIGFPFVSIVVNIPQRAQAVNGLSPVRAGMTLLPLLLTSPFATAGQGILTSNFKVPPFDLMLIGAVLQLVGVIVGLTGSLPTDRYRVAPSRKPDAHLHICSRNYKHQTAFFICYGILLVKLLLTIPKTLANQECRVLQFLSGHQRTFRRKNNHRRVLHPAGTNQGLE